MYSNFEMKEATNKNEAIISILDVLEENPVWLNKVTDSLFILLKSIEKEHQEGVVKARKEASIVRQYNENKIITMERTLRKLRKETQNEYDILSQQQTKCAQMDAKANELRISIKTLKELL